MRDSRDGTFVKNQDMVKASASFAGIGCACGSGAVSRLASDRAVDECRGMLEAKSDAAHGSPRRFTVQGTSFTPDRYNLN